MALMWAHVAQSIHVKPEDIHAHQQYKPIVWHEGGSWEEHDITEFLGVLKSLDRGETLDPLNNPYTNRWGGEAAVRMARLPFLYESIKKNGVIEPICVERTGERLDGSFRSKIALHLGHSTVPAKLFAFNRRNITEDFIERKLKSRGLSVKSDYYAFDYGNGWKNVDSKHPVLAENATARWEVLKDLVKEDSVLDIGCNEGYLSLQLALQGKRVRGIDVDYIHLAWLNKLIFEFVNECDLNANYEWGKIEDVLAGDEKAALLLNVLYHLPRNEQKILLSKLKGKTLYFQCNLRKSKERETYYTSHPDDLKELLTSMGFSVLKEIEWRDKPIIIAK